MEKWWIQDLLKEEWVSPPDTRYRNVTLVKTSVSSAGLSDVLQWEDITGVSVVLILLAFFSQCFRDAGQEGLHAQDCS